MNSDKVLETIFDCMEYEDLFDLKDEELTKLQKDMSNSSSKLYKLINIAPNKKYKKKLKHLTAKRNTTVCDYFHRENVLYFKNGFVNGIKLMAFVNSLVK